MADTRIAKLFKNGASQAVRLPAEFRFEGDEVYATRDEATGDVVLQLTSSGQPIGELDMMIAAHSLSSGAILVTNNIHHYQRIEAPLVLGV